MQKIFLILLMAIMMPVAGMTQTNFRDMTYEEALVAAKQENKLVFIDFYTTWCGPCKMMINTVFPQKKVGDYLNKRFVCIKLDAEKEGKDLAELHQVKAYPTFIGLDANEKVIMNKVGGGQADDFIAAIERQLDPEKNPQRLKERYETGERTPDLINSYAGLLLEQAYEKNDREKEKETFNMVQDYFNGLNDIERLNPDNLFIYMTYTNSITNPAAQYMISHRDEFDPSVKEEVAKRIEQLFQYQVNGYLICSIPYDENTFQTTKKNMIDLGLDQDKYSTAFRLIECHATGDLNAYLKLCKRLNYKLSKDQQYSLVTGFSSVINTSDKVIREKASKFIRSLLAEMSINQMYFVIMDLRQLEVGSEH